MNRSLASLALFLIWLSSSSFVSATIVRWGEEPEGLFQGKTSVDEKLMSKLYARLSEEMREQEDAYQLELKQLVIYEGLVDQRISEHQRKVMELRLTLAAMAQRKY